MAEHATEQSASMSVGFSENSQPGQAGRLGRRRAPAAGLSAHEVPSGDAMGLVTHESSIGMCNNVPHASNSGRPSRERITSYWNGKRLGRGKSAGRKRNRESKKAKKSQKGRGGVHIIQDYVIAPAFIRSESCTRLFSYIPSTLGDFQVRKIILIST